jgi:hypothetical protein
MRKSNNFMLCREINAACSEDLTRFENTPCGQNVEFRKINLVVYKINTFFKGVREEIFTTLLW